MGILQKYSFKKRHILYAAIAVVTIYLLTANTSCTEYVMKPAAQSPTAGTNSRYTYTVPLDPTSPWPKFRANALQNGRSEVIPEMSNLKPWTFQTGKGVFSSPVIDNDGTVYIGSGDQYFYALDKTGKVKWKTLTGEIIDSSALLDDKGRIYVGSGDGHVYALERSNGQVLWKFRAHTPRQVTEKFGVKTYNLDWFEGNIAMLADGTILAPNDNYLIYHLDREIGQAKTQNVLNEMGWSLPAVNAKTGLIITGSNFMALKNVFAFDAKTGAERWTNGGFGTNAASVLLTSDHPNGAAIIGGFDGMLRAFGQKDGHQIWKFGTRDHIYASPAQLKDGTIIQASTDGTVYALDPTSGTVQWAFDTKEPVRSSPAVDGLDRIYFGSGEGRLVCLNPDGTLRWAYEFINDNRNDINGSPGLGREGIYIAGESGGVFFMPYDYPLSTAGKKDPRSVQGPHEDLPEDGTYLFYTTAFGSLELQAPAEIEANQPLCFTLYIRKNGDTQKSAIDRDTVRITVAGGAAGRVDTSANYQFITMIPQEMWTGPAGGTISIHIKGAYKTNLSRIGLKFFGGSTGGQFEQTFTFKVRPRTGKDMPFKVPATSGDPASMIEISRVAPANPSILPSYNQIGYDSLHYLLGAVEGKGNTVILWGIGGKLIGQDQKTVVDPSLKVRFPLMLNYDRGLITLNNYDGFLLDMNGSWDMPLALYRIATRVDPLTGATRSTAAINAIAECDKIEFYGYFLKLLGMSEFDTGLMFIFAGANYNLHGRGLTQGVGGTGSVSFSMTEHSLVATIKGGTLNKKDHVFSILPVSEETGRPVPLKYIDDTLVTADENGVVTGVVLSLGDSKFHGKVRVYYMVDTYPAYKGSIVIK